MHECEPKRPCSRDRLSWNVRKTPSGVRAISSCCGHEKSLSPCGVCAISSCCGREKSLSALIDRANARKNDLSICATTVCARHLDADHPLRASGAPAKI